MEEQRYIPPMAFFILGAAILVASFVIWSITHQQSELFVGASLTLMGAGVFQRWRIKIVVDDGPKLPIPPTLAEGVKDLGEGKASDGSA